MGDFMNKTMSAIKGAIYALSMVGVVSVSAMDKAASSQSENQVFNEKNFALCEAAWLGDIEKAKALLEAGANPNVAIERMGDWKGSGCTKQTMALFCAIDGSRLKMVKFLLENNARLDIKNGEGQTPIEFAEACLRGCAGSMTTSVMFLPCMQVEEPREDEYGTIVEYLKEENAVRACKK
ncbi:hypothetical protein FACS189449_06270 [Alphaproteobacteria bacterium]|nr:hypothetical protein FACS189449_06270 [Alphaproteobacteria bacterium]